MVLNLSKKILIADDESLTRWSLKEALTQEGHEVIVVEDGKKAVEEVKKENFDFIITDLFMPEMDGWKVLDMIRQINPSTKVIVITAYGEEGEKKRAKEQGAYDYIEKPYLIERIRNILKQNNEKI